MRPQRMPGARAVRQWQKLLADGDESVRRALQRAYGNSQDVLDQKLVLLRRAVDAFVKAFGADGEAICVRSAGRVNLVGMHIDHRGGYVNPVAIGDVIFVAQAREDDRVVLRNIEPERFGDREFSVRQELPAEKIDDWDQWTQANLAKLKAAGAAGDWSNYVRAAVLYLQHLHTADDGSFRPALRGMNVMICGALPVCAGLSSSSSIVVGSAEACRHLNRLKLNDMEMVEACALAEWYVGTRGGGGDHAAIKFGRLDHVTHIGSFPLSVDWVPFPSEYRIVLANSMIRAEKSVGARDVFNQRVASYVFALLMVRKEFPEYAFRLEHLRDLNPRILGVDEAEVYRIIRRLPERAQREDIRRMLSEHADLVEHTFGSHAEPADGYNIRQVCMYGVSGCLRSELAVQMLRAGDVKGFGKLMSISHDGDRVTRLEAGRRVPVANRYPDEKIDALLADLASGDADRQERARLWRQGGGYNASIEQLDELVDIAQATPGVVGAGLVGAGLGGSVVAVVETHCAGRLVEAYATSYYKPRGLDPAATIIRPLGGAGVLEVD